MKVESRWKMWSMEILTISIKRWHPGNNVLSTERFTGKQRFHERFAANKLFSALDHAPHPLLLPPLHCFLQAYRKALCGFAVRSRRYPPPSFPSFFIFPRPTINHRPPFLFFPPLVLSFESSVSLAAFRIDRDRYSIEPRLETLRFGRERGLSGWGRRKKKKREEKRDKVAVVVNGISRSNKETSRGSLGSIGCWKSGCFTEHNGISGVVARRATL